jgi:hypothetical protein
VIELSSQALVLKRCFGLVPFLAQIVVWAVGKLVFPPRAPPFAPNRNDAIDHSIAKTMSETIRELHCRFGCRIAARNIDVARTRSKQAKDSSRIADRHRSNRVPHRNRGDCRNPYVYRSKCYFDLPREQRLNRIVPGGIFEKSLGYL